MRKFFYFSNKSLKFVEIKNFKAKTFAFILISSFVLSSVFFGIYYTVYSLLSSKDKTQLELENSLLKENLKNLSLKYASLKEELNNLNELSNNLRKYANLRPITDSKTLGTGGNIFSENLSTFLKDKSVNSSIRLIEEITKNFEIEKAEFERISEKLKTNDAFYSSIPAIIPTTGGYSIEGFGMRFHPILKVTKMHEGLDILTDVGSPVFAPGDGRVTYVGNRGGYGLTIEIDHGFGYKTVYAHLSKSLVNEGKIVKRGEKFALTGNSGLSTGPHLHYEVHFNGVPQDPINFFFEDFNYFEAKKLNKKGSEK